MSPRLVAVLDERPLGDEQRGEHEQGAEPPDAGGDPEHDEQEADDAVADVGHAGGAQQLDDLRPHGDAVGHPHHAGEEDGVGQALGDVGHDQREPHPGQDVQRPLEGGHILLPTREQVDQPAHRPDDAAQRDVEQPHREGDPLGLDGRGRGADDAGADRAHDHRGREQDDADQRDLNPVSGVGVAQEPAGDRERGEHRQGHQVVGAAGHSPADAQQHDGQHGHRHSESLRRGTQSSRRLRARSPRRHGINLDGSAENLG